MQMEGASVGDAAGQETWRSETMTYICGAFDAGDIEILRGGLGDEVELV